MNIYKPFTDNKIFSYKIWFLIFFIVSIVHAHEGEPSHGGDLPVDLGGNRMQYEGRQNLVDIKVENNMFLPEKVTIDTGGILAFQNKDNVEHRIMFSTGDPGDQEEHDHPVGGHERTHILMPEKYWVLEFLVPG